MKRGKQRINTDIDDLEPLLQQLIGLFGEVVPHSLHGRRVALIDVHITNRAAKGRVGEIRVLLAADRVVEHKDASSPGPGQRQRSSLYSQSGYPGDPWPKIHKLTRLSATAPSRGNRCS